MTVRISAMKSNILSQKSVAVTMKCAGYPHEPDPPILIIGNRDIISVTW